MVSSRFVATVPKSIEVTRIPYVGANSCRSSMRKIPLQFSKHFQTLQLHKSELVEWLKVYFTKSTLHLKFIHYTMIGICCMILL